VLGYCKSLWFESWSPTIDAVVELKEQAFIAVYDFDELGACDLWTGNCSTLSVPAVSQSYLGTVRKLQSKACVVCLSRLETRTKESNMCASHWECKPKGVMKVKI
jgi:hypothetical protein